MSATIAIVRACAVPGGTRGRPLVVKHGGSSVDACWDAGLIRYGRDFFHFEVTEAGRVALERAFDDFGGGI